LIYFFCERNSLSRFKLSSILLMSSVMVTLLSSIDSLKFFKSNSASSICRFSSFITCSWSLTLSFMLSLSRMRFRFCASKSAMTSYLDFVSVLFISFDYKGGLIFDIRTVARYRQRSCLSRFLPTNASLLF